MLLRHPNTSLQPALTVPISTQGSNLRPSAYSHAPCTGFVILIPTRSQLRFVPIGPIIFDFNFNQPSLLFTLQLVSPHDAKCLDIAL